MSLTPGQERKLDRFERNLRKIQPMPANVSERDFQLAVVDLAKRAGWLVFHPLPALAKSGHYMTATQGDVGYPDLTLVHRKRKLVLFVELKSHTGRVSIDQTMWGAALTEAGADYRLVRPHDWVLLANHLLGG